MKKLYIIFISFVAPLFFAPSPLFAEEKTPELEVILYHSPGSIEVDAQGVFSGTTIDRIEPILKASGLKYHYVLMPWVRAYRRLEDNNNSIIVNLIRTAEREEKYHWILKIRSYDIYLITRNTPDMANLSVEDIIHGPYRSVCERNSALCNMLREFGFSEDKIVKVNDKTEAEHASLVLAGRFDYFISDEDLLKLQLKPLGIDLNSLKFQHLLDRVTPYLAANKALHPEILKQLQRASHELEALTD